MGDFGADTLRDSIVSGWTFTSTQRISKTVTASMTEVVQFFAHPQLLTPYTKAVEVKKIDPPENENVTTHPDFEEVNDFFEVSCRYRLDGTDEVLYDQAEQDIEDMCIEVVRIIKTVYNPLDGTGNYFRMQRTWVNRDSLDGTKPELVRTLRLSLTTLVGKSSETFRGFGGVLQLDTSASTADSKPAADHTYAAVHNVDWHEGFGVQGVVTNDTANGIGVPVLFRGRFGGTIRFESQATKDDINTSTIEAFDNIYKTQSAGELAEVVLLHATTNTEGSPITLTMSTNVMITDMRKVQDDEDLVKFIVSGTVTKPSTATVA
jgi:hypothetical protein